MMLANVFLLLTRSLASAHRIAEILDENIVLTSPENGVKKSRMEALILKMCHSNIVRMLASMH